MKRRHKGEGTIRKRTDGTFEARYTIGKDINGKQRQKSVYGKSEADVIERLDRLKKDLWTGTYIEQSNIYLGEWLKQWMEVYKKKTLRATTYECYQMYLQKHIYKNDISCLRLVDLKPFHIQRFYNDLDDKLASASIRKVHNILKSALTQAFKNDLIASNPAAKVTPPTMTRPQIEILSQEEQEIFIKALEGHTLKPLFLLLMQTGLRIGEALALRWDCIDVKKNMTLTVKGTCRRVITKFDGSSGTKSEMIFQEPKTKNSIRTVPLMPAAIQNLKLLKQRQKLESIKDGKPWNNHEIVFKTSSGSIYESKNVARTLYSILKSAGLKRITLHCLRHTFVSQMLESGEEPKTIAEIIGHSKVSFTMDTYAHILPTKKHSAVQRLNHFFTQYK
jgi:integrase